MIEYAVTTDNLTKDYGHSAAVNGINLRVPRGAVYGFLGRNGAGKTTTIRMLLGLARPSAGSISVLGLDPRKDRVSMLSRTGYVAEQKQLFPTMNARQLIAFNRGFYRDTWSDALAAKCEERLEIPMETPFDQLSLGNKTKVCLAVAIAQHSEMLILDEPTSGLDPVAMDQLLSILVEDCTAEGRTIFLSTHQLPQIEQIVDWIGILDHGKLLIEESLDEVRARYRLVIASGAALPAASSGQVLSVKREGNQAEYLVDANAEVFAAGLSSQGAAIADIVPVPLTELFLRLCRPEAAA